MTHPRHGDDLLWGYWATHVTDIRFSPVTHPVYRQLRDLVAGRDHFVMSSNVDALLARNGFDPDRVFTMQGDYGLYQCETPCTRHPHLPTGRGLQAWLRDAPADERLLVFDIGSGYNTSRRHPLAHGTSCARRPNSRLIRINPQHREVLARLAGRAIGTDIGANRLLTALVTT